MALQLENGFCCIKHCCGIYEENNIVNIISIDDWTADVDYVLQKPLNLEKKCVWKNFRYF